METPEQPASVPRKGKKSRNVLLEHDGGAKATLSEPASRSAKKTDDIYATDHDFLIVNSPMDGELFVAVMKAVSANKKNKHLVLFW